MNLREKFTNNMRKLRIEHNLSQEELADKAGLHRTYIGSVERGERNITIDVMEKICNALEVPITDLFKKNK
ncbi:MAG: helix-turn-helix transcriptional regulator [Spirochaetaceae bacterium]|nr:helix-turn-helix transcriptional regulator [Spirochaetaceae bacterium]